MVRQRSAKPLFPGSSPGAASLITALFKQNDVSPHLQMVSFRSCPFERLTCHSTKVSAAAGASNPEKRLDSIVPPTYFSLESRVSVFYIRLVPTRTSKLWKSKLNSAVSGADIKIYRFVSL